MTRPRLTAARPDLDICRCGDSRRDHPANGACALCRAFPAQWGGCMTLADLIRDETTGMTSHSKLAAIIGFLAATIVFVRVCWNATPSDGLAWLFLVYMGTAAGNQVASKLMGLKWGAKNGNGRREADRAKTARDLIVVAMNQVVEERDALRTVWHTVADALREWTEEIDAEEIRDAAIAAGLMERVEYDPAQHPDTDADEGDMIYRFTPLGHRLAALPAGQPDAPAAGGE